MALMSFTDFAALKSSGQWTPAIPVSLPLTNVGVACPQCGVELQTTFVPIAGENPPRYRFICPNCRLVQIL